MKDRTWILGSIAASLLLCSPVAATSAGKAICGSKIVCVEVMIDPDTHTEAKSPLYDPVGIPPFLQVANTSVRYAHTEGTRGRSYAIRVYNTHGRTSFEVCPAVDGRSAVHGKAIGAAFTSHATWDGGCYIVRPHKNIAIRGWRSSGENEKRFVFSELDQSLAVTKWRDPTNVGTMVLAIFEEDTVRPMERPTEPQSGSGRSRSGGLGTGAGADVHSPVTEVPFKAQDEAVAAFVIGYGTKDRLIEAGIIKPEGSEGHFGQYGKPKANPYIDFK